MVNKKIVFIIIGIILLALISIGIFLLISPKSKVNNHQQSNNPYETSPSEETGKIAEDMKNNYSNDNQPVDNSFNEEGSIKMNQELAKQYGVTLESAEKVLAEGTKIIDATNDWISTKNPADNPSYYPINFADLKEIDIGIDDKYLYVKGIYNGVWPNKTEEWPSVEGNNIIGVNYGFNINTDNNRGTGSPADGGAEIFAGVGLKKEATHLVYCNYKKDPTGIEDPEEKRFLTTSNNNLWFAGPGYDYVISVYPLKNLSLTKGQKVTINIWAEANSEKYEHASFDILGTPVKSQGYSPLEADIPIVLGENKIIK